MHSVHHTIQLHIICIQFTCCASAKSSGDVIDVYQCFECDKTLDGIGQIEIQIVLEWSRVKCEHMHCSILC